MVTLFEFSSPKNKEWHTRREQNIEKSVTD